MIERVALATDHPATEGLAGCLVLIAAVLAPIVGGYLLAEYVILTSGTTDAWLYAYGFGVAGALGGVWLFNRVLWGTIVREWIASFVDWSRRYGIMNVDMGEQA